MDIYRLLDELEMLIEHGKDDNWTSKVRLLRRIFLLEVDDVVTLIQQIRTSLPKDMQQALNVIEEQENMLRESQEISDKKKDEAATQAEMMIRQAQEDAKVLVSNHEITRTADIEAKKINEQALRNAEEIRNGALVYADNLIERTLRTLDNTASQITQLQATAKSSREELRKNFG